MNDILKATLMDGTVTELAVEKWYTRSLCGKPYRFALHLQPTIGLADPQNQRNLAYQLSEETTGTRICTISAGKGFAIRYGDVGTDPHCKLTRPSLYQHASLQLDGLIIQHSEAGVLEAINKQLERTKEAIEERQRQQQEQEQEQEQEEGERKECGEPAPAANDPEPTQPSPDPAPAPAMKAPARNQPGKKRGSGKDADKKTGPRRNIL